MQLVENVSTSDKSEKTKQRSKSKAAASVGMSRPTLAKAQNVSRFSESVQSMAIGESEGAEVPRAESERGAEQRPCRVCNPKDEDEKGEK